MQSLLPFRWLALVCVAALAVGYREYHRQTVDVYSDEQRNYPEAMAQLYPGTAQAAYLAGRREEAMAVRGLNPAKLQRPEELKRFLDEFHQRMAKARAHYERALQGGLRSEENLHYNYALTLIRLRAEPGLIDRAIADWRRNFPHSTLRDLASRRPAMEEELERLDQVLVNSRQQQERQQKRQNLEQLYGPSRQDGP